MVSWCFSEPCCINFPYLKEICSSWIFKSVERSLIKYWINTHHPNDFSCHCHTFFCRWCISVLWKVPPCSQGELLNVCAMFVCDMRTWPSSYTAVLSPPASMPPRLLQSICWKHQVFKVPSTQFQLRRGGHYLPLWEGLLQGWERSSKHGLYTWVHQQTALDLLPINHKLVGPFF